jgi:hypothetical protein
MEEPLLDRFYKSRSTGKLYLVLAVVDCEIYKDKYKSAKGVIFVDGLIAKRYLRNLEEFNSKFEIAN